VPSLAELHVHMMLGAAGFSFYKEAADHGLFDWEFCQRLAFTAETKKGKGGS
jgi:hypothetical protein